MLSTGSADAQRAMPGAAIGGTLIPAPSHFSTLACQPANFLSLHSIQTGLITV